MKAFVSRVFVVALALGVLLPLQPVKAANEVDGAPTPSATASR